MESRCRGVFFNVAVYLPLRPRPADILCCGGGSEGETRAGFLTLDKNRGGYPDLTRVPVTVITRACQTRLIVSLPFPPSDIAELFDILARAAKTEAFRRSRERLVRGPVDASLALYSSKIGCTWPGSFCRHRVRNCRFAAPDELRWGRPEDERKLRYSLSFMSFRFDLAVLKKFELVGALKHIQK